MQAIRPLYLSPIGRGGVDFGIQNILRSVRRAGLSDAELLRLPEIYNFAPFLIGRGLPQGWWRNFDIIQGRSRVAFALRAPDRPLVTTVHHLTTDPDLLPYSSPAQRIFYRLIEHRYDGLSVRNADAVVCVSRYTQEQVRTTFGKQDTVLIFDGIDTDVFTPTEEFVRTDHGVPPNNARIRLLFVGNRTRRKGFDLLPRIMDRLPADYHLFYTGGFQGRDAGPPHPRMTPIGSPSREGLVAAYQSSDILLFPSRLEGFGIAPAEALACARPVVTTRISALPEVVDDGLNGFLCRRNAVDEYAARVLELGEDPALRRSFGEHGRRKVVTTFGYDQLGNGFVALYQRLLGGNQQGGA